MFSETVRCYLAGKTGALWRFAVTWPRWDRSRHAFNTQKCQLCSTETGGWWPHLAEVSCREESNSLHFSASTISPAACWVSRLGSLKCKKIKKNQENFRTAKKQNAFSKNFTQRSVEPRYDTDTTPN